MSYRPLSVPHAVHANHDGLHATHSHNEASPNESLVRLQILEVSSMGESLPLVSSIYSSVSWEVLQQSHDRREVDICVVISFHDVLGLEACYSIVHHVIHLQQKEPSSHYVLHSPNSDTAVNRTVEMSFG